MVIQTSDANARGSQDSFDISKELLNKFISPRKKQSTDLSGTASTAADGRNGNIARSATPRSTTSSQPNRVSVVISSRRPESAAGSDSTVSKKRKYGSATPVSDNSSNQPTVFPDHHGLSGFYDTADRRRATSYQSAKMIDRTAAHLERPLRKFRPSMQDNPGTELDELRELYAKKLTSIKGPPITFDWRGQTSYIDFNFEFINSYKLRRGVKRVSLAFHCGCACSGTQCNPSTCGCLSQEEHTDERIVPYKRGSDGICRLRDRFLKRRAMIYECNYLCGCGPDCWNRVVQKGRTVRLEIFQTKDRGCGMYSQLFDNIYICV